jgi:hypothetical protein
MKSLSAAALTATLLAFTAMPAIASDDHARHRSSVSYQTLVEFCAKAKPDSRTSATLVARDGTRVTGIVDCETDYEFYSQARGYDDHGRHRGDDDRRDDDHDDRWDD